MSRNGRQPRRKVVPRKLPQQDRSQRTVEQILTAARKVLLTSGLDAFTTNHIALHSGLSVGSIYQYFPNKQAIVSSLYERWLTGVQALLAEFDREPTAAEDPHELRARLLERIYANWTKDPLNLKFVAAMQNAARLYPELQAREAEHQEIVATRLGSLLRKHGSKLPAVQLHALGRYLYAMHIGLQAIVLGGNADYKLMLRTHRRISESIMDDAISGKRQDRTT